MNDNRNVSVNDDETMKPERKRLRSSEPDLKISVGANDEAVDYWYHSSVMATHSNYIDAMLATPMQESKAYEISFPDIAPTTWESMLKFLEGPMEARLMTIEDAMEVALEYDKYDFRKGCQLCDQVLKEYFQDKKKILANLSCFVDAVLLANAANLEEAKKVGLEWLRQTLGSRDSQTGGIIFTENHIRKLVPLIIKEDALFQIITSVIASCFSGHDVKSKEDLRSPLLSCFLVTAYARFETLRMLRNAPPQIMLSGTGCDAEGLFSRDPDDNYTCNRIGVWAGVQVNFRLEFLADESGWAILSATLPEIDEDGNPIAEDVVRNVLWRCPNSHSLPLPPQDGWIPVHESAIGRQPTVSYRMDKGRAW
jgi:hypothetical protein